MTLEYVTVIARATMKDTETIKLASPESIFSNVYLKILVELPFTGLRKQKRSL